MLAGQRNDNANLSQLKALAMKALKSRASLRTSGSVARVDFGEHSATTRVQFGSTSPHNKLNLLITRHVVASLLAALPFAGLPFLACSF